MGKSAAISCVYGSFAEDARYSTLFQVYSDGEE
jgi:hypothetical protein